MRLHGSQALYASRYEDAELAAWAARIAEWASPPSGRDVYVYFDNDVDAHAPYDAAALARRLGVGPLGAGGAATVGVRT